MSVFEALQRESERGIPVRASRRLNLDSGGTGLVAVLVDVHVLRVELLLQNLPLRRTVVDQVVDHADGTVLLLLCTLGAVRLQGLRQDSLQLVGIGGATALVQQALVVVVEQPIGLEDLVDVDAVVLGGVLVLGGDGHDEQGKGDEALHVLAGEKREKRIILRLQF